MAKLRDKVAARCQPLLPAQAPIRQVFMCQTGPSPYWILLTWLIFPWIKYRIVCVTDDAVHVFRARKLVPSMPKELVASLPREGYFGAVSGLWGQVTLMGERHWVHKRFHKDVEAADRSMPAAPAAPPPPPAQS